MHDDQRDPPPPRHAPEKVARARAFCEALLVKLGGDVAVEVRETPEAIGVALTPRDGNGLELSSALVEAVQTLVNRVANPPHALPRPLSVGRVFNPTAPPPAAANPQPVSNPTYRMRLPVRLPSAPASSQPSWPRPSAARSPSAIYAAGCSTSCAPRAPTPKASPSKPTITPTPT